MVEFVKYSASYTNLNPNFCISKLNIVQSNTSEKDRSIIAVIRNIVNRGVLVAPSSYLREAIGGGKKFTKPTYFFETKKLNWSSTIKGSVDKNPAEYFYNNVLLGLVNNNITIYNSFIPELPIKDVLLDTDETLLSEMYLDFYSPLLKCNIEIDGSQHREKNQKMSDYERDKILKKHGINVVRINVSDIGKLNYKIKNLATKWEDDHFVENKEDKSLDNYSAAIRYQMALLQLLEQGKISFDDKKWNFNIVQNKSVDKQIFEHAAKDILVYARELRVLQEEEKPNIEINVAVSNDVFAGVDGVKIDLDLFSKYDDSCFNENIVYIRNDYFLYDFMANITYQKEVSRYVSCKNYYKVSNAKTFYNLSVITEEKRDALRYFLKVIFSFDKFLSKQEEIIFECLRIGAVIGLLPTSAGKSLCYQLTSMLLPGVTLVVSPLKILMKDQYENMSERHSLSNICYINSDSKGTTELVKQNQAKICLISPERFFNEDFLSVLRTKKIDVSMIAIDEVHCLSEWGHDFRTSYLCLSHYLKLNLKNDCFLMGLTATASPRVCEDIDVEFDNYKGITKIIQSNSLARHNLKIEVNSFLTTVDKKYGSTKRAELLSECNFWNKLDKTIVFTRTKSDRVINSCVNLAAFIQKELPEIKEKVEFFAASSDVLDKEKDAIENDKKLQDFKHGRKTLLFSTKAFGMGVDIPDIRKTIHYELPSSLESLYQEFGRAGRDGKESVCKIWYYAEKETALNELFNGDFSIENVKKHKSMFSELQTNLYFLTSSNLDPQYELFFEKFLYDYLRNEKKSACDVRFSAKEFISVFHDAVGYLEIKDDNGFIIDKMVDEEYEDKVLPEFDYKAFIDKALYRLFLIGKISMWGVRYSADLKNPVYINIDVFNPSVETQKCNVSKYIQKYEPLYTYKGELNPDALMKELIVWAFNHFVYQRLQSIKNIYEACREYRCSEQFMDIIIKYLSREEENDVLLSNPSDYKIWFKLLKSKSLIELKSIIARYLETDDKLVSLNFISGIVRLLLDDYDDSDGERRLRMAFEDISRFSEEEIDDIINGFLSVVVDNNYRDKAITTIISANPLFIDSIYKKYQNAELESNIVYNIAKKMSIVGGKINDKCRKN